MWFGLLFLDWGIARRSTRMFLSLLGTKSTMNLSVSVALFTTLLLGATANSILVDVAHAQDSIKANIVKIVTKGTRTYNGATATRTYVGSGFIVHTARDVGGAQTVIVT